jgi:hypothetical protein
MKRALTLLLALLALAVLSAPAHAVPPAHAHAVGKARDDVVAYGYGNLKNVLFGPYQGTVAQQLYASAGAS